MSTKQILLAAARELREHGWCQGQAVDHKGRLCALGAINLTAGDRDAAAYHAVNALKAHLGVPWIDDWNDSPDRTQEEVIAALEGAAEMVENHNA